MSRKLPDTLGASFWLTLAVAAMWLGLAYVGWAMDQGGKIAIALIFAALFLHVAIKRLREVRIVRRLKDNPQLLGLYRLGRPND